MRKALLLTALLAGSLLGANAQTTDNVKAFVKPGAQKQLAIQLKNDVDYTAFQVTIKLPSTMSFTDAAPMLSDRKDATHQIKYNKVDDHTMRVAVFSVDNLEGTPTTGNLAFKNDRKALLLVDVNITGDYRTEGFSVNEITLDEVEFVMLNGLKANNNLTVKVTGKLGDVNSDGKINTSDASDILTKVVGGELANYDADAEDVDCDGKVNTSDASELLTEVVRVAQ